MEKEKERREKREKERIEKEKIQKERKEKREKERLERRINLEKSKNKIESEKINIKMRKEEENEEEEEKEEEQNIENEEEEKYNLEEINNNNKHIKIKRIYKITNNLKGEDEEEKQINTSTKKYYISKEINFEDETDGEISEEDEEELIYDNNIINSISIKNSKILKKRKPISRTMYDNLLEKMMYIINKYKNEINATPDNSDTKYNDILNGYMNTLEYKIICLKNAYLYTLIKKHYCNNDIIKRKIIIQGNIPRKRNEVKLCFNELISFIKNTFKDNEEIQKYYYMLVLNILIKYENISDEDIQMAKKLYKENKLDELNYIQEKSNQINNEKNVWIRQIKSNYNKKNIFRLFTVAIPLIYISSYFYTNLIA